MKRNFLGAYAAPQLRVCNCSIERGFAISGATDFDDLDYDGRTEE